MQLKIGVCGSAHGPFPHGLKLKAQLIGQTIARNKGILLSGAGLGLSYEAVQGAKSKKGFTVGFSPALNLFEHIDKYHFPTEYFDLLLFTGFGFKGRNLLFVRSCDAIILISGKIGTLNEFTIAYDEGKHIGVLRESGGISEEIQTIITATGKETEGKVVYISDPSSLVESMINCLRGGNSIREKG